MKLHYLTYMLVSALYGVHGQETCTTPDGGIGLCKYLRECSAVYEKAQAYGNASSDERQRIMAELRQRRCGFEGNNWKVCCEDCITPDGKSGIRKHIRDCPYLLNLLTSGSNASLMYVKRSRSDHKLNVCCGANSVVGVEQCNSVINSAPDPESKCCGRDVSGGDRIVGGITASIDEFPWLVLIEYSKNGTIKLLCGGTLISNRYVVSAAHCLRVKDAIPVNVRLGEYDIDNPRMDCASLPDGSKDCTSGHISVPIERITAHPEYNTKNNHNDIALIKLKYSVKYTDFVRPICLPTSESRPTDVFTVAGWGRVNETTNRSRYKQALVVNRFESEECRRLFGARANIWEKQLCAGGEPGRDSCSGDSGGPLMLESGTGHFELAGIVSYGTRHCGLAGVPGVYTSVYHYVDWIRQHMRD